MGLGLNPPKFPDPSSGSDEEEFTNDLTSRDGLVSLKEFLEHNQASMLVLLQRRLINSDQKNILEKKESSCISANTVGPMGILREKFGNDDD